MEKLITTTQAAEIVGVGVSSIKRWADEELIRTVRTPGGHRRLDLDDLLSFIARGNESNTATPAKNALVQKKAEDQDWAEIFLRSDHHSLMSNLLAARSRLGSWAKVATVVGGGLHEVGLRWRAGTISIYEERIASQRLATALASVHYSMPQSPNSRVCLLACAEGELHTLGLSLLRLVLSESGWSSLWIGEHTPMTEICKTVDASDVDMVAISATTSFPDPVLLVEQQHTIVDTCRRRDVSLVFGGHGAWANDLGYGTVIRDFEAFGQLARSLNAPN